MKAKHFHNYKQLNTHLLNIIYSRVAEGAVRSCNYLHSYARKAKSMHAMGVSGRNPLSVSHY